LFLRSYWFFNLHSAVLFFPGGAGDRKASVELGSGGGRGSRAEGRAGGREEAAQDHLLPSHPGTVLLLVQNLRLPVVQWLEQKMIVLDFLIYPSSCEGILHLYKSLSFSFVSCN